MYNEEFEDEKEEKQSDSFIKNFYYNNKVKQAVSHCNNKMVMVLKYK